MNGQHLSSKSGFTLIEVILVVVISVIILGVSLPYFSGTYKGMKLQSAARTVSQMARYARSMAILRGKTHTVGLDRETMEIYLIATAAAPENTADGELDQAVLKSLGYVEDDAEGPVINKEVHRLLPEGLTIIEFESETEEDPEDLEVYHIDYHPNGMSDAFLLVFEDAQGSGIRLESDPISGKVKSEFVQ